MLDEIRSGTVGDYTNLINQFATYQDLKDHGVSYSAISGLPIYDYSGNLNDGYALNASSAELMPLVAGTVRGTEILSNTVIHLKIPGIATKYYSDNSFDIELWTKLPDNSSSEIMLLGDSSNNIGLFYHNNNVIFKIGSNEIQYRYTNKQAIHIVGQFSTNQMNLFIDGVNVKSISLNKYKFTNEEIDFCIGPAANLIVVDAVAFYRFNLTLNQINKHYAEGTKEINYFQIVHSDNGYLFTMNHSSIKPVFRYSYPKSKTWNELADNNISVSADGSYIYFQQTDIQESKSFSFIDEIFIPEHLGVTSSQIYWEDDVDGILVEASLDGVSWQECKNGNPIPFFNKNDNQVSNVLYLRISVSSSDTSKYLPVLRSIYLDFFKNKKLYADNFGYFIYSDYDYSLPPFNSKTLLANRYNGLRMLNGHGFTLSDGISAKSIEMIFTPSSGQNVLVSAPSKIYEWNPAGVINKVGISSIFVNGINRTSSTNISEFLTEGLPHHIVITFLASATQSIKFNQNQGDTKSGINHMYSNIAIYENKLTQPQIAKHYLLYTDNLISTVSDTSFLITESLVGNDSTAFILFSVQPDAISV